MQRENVKFKDTEIDLCVAGSVKFQVFGAKYGRQNMVGNNVIDHMEEQIMGGSCNPVQGLVKVGSQ